MALQRLEMTRLSQYLQNVLEVKAKRFKGWTLEHDQLACVFDLQLSAVTTPTYCRMNQKETESSVML